MTLLTRIRALREGGAVERFHAVPHIGPARVDSHSHNMVSMLFVLHPDPSMALVKAVHWHDSQERWSGDMPHGTKQKHHVLRHELAIVERQYAAALGISFILTPDEEQWLRELDTLEAMMYAADQIALGNSNMRKTYQDAYHGFTLQWALLHPEVRDIVGTMHMISQSWIQLDYCDVEKAG